MFDFLNKLDSRFKLGFGLAMIIGIALAFYFNGNAREQSGITSERNRWLLDIANKPVKRDTSIVHDTIPGDIQWLKGEAIIDTSAQAELMKTLSKTVQEINRLRDSLNTQELTAEKTFRDSLGGTHELRYSFGKREFSEKYTPSARYRELMTVHERQELPYEISRIWTAGLSFEYHKEPGFGVLAGVRPLGLGVSYFPGSNTFLYRVEATWTF